MSLIADTSWEHSSISWKHIGSRLIFHPGINVAKMLSLHTYLILSHQNIHIDQIDLCLFQQNSMGVIAKCSRKQTHCSLSHWWVRDRVSSLARDPDHFLCLRFIPSVYVPKSTFPIFSSLLWKMLEGDILKLQSCFTF